MQNNCWTKIRIKTNNAFYSGPARLKLEAFGLTPENKVSFLITTNTLQKNPEMKLYENGNVIENGRFLMSYREIRYKETLVTFSILFLFALLVVVFNKKILNNMKKFPAVYMAAILFIFSVLKEYNEFYNVNKHVTPQYFSSWFDLGFVRRGLIGTIIDIFNINFDINLYIKYGIVCIAILLILQLYIINNRKFENDRYLLNKYYILFLCMPFPLLAFTQHHFFGRLDELLMILFLLSCVVIIKEKGLFLIPIFAVAGTMIHEMYTALLIPFIFCILLYKWSISKQIKYLICLLITSVSSVFFAAYFSFIAKTSTTFDEVWSKMQANYDERLLWDFAIRVNYFMSKNEIFDINAQVIYEAQTIPAAIYSTLFLAPIIFMSVKWLIEYYKMQDNSISKIVVLIFPLTFGGLAVTMYLTCDWGRLLVMYGFAVFFSFITLWSFDRERVKQSINNVFAKFDRKNKNIYFICLCVFYMALTICGSSSTTLFDFSRVIVGL